MSGLDKSVNLLLWIIVLAGLLLCGCAADRAYDEGVILLERGNYATAIAKLKQAVRFAEGDKFVDDLEKPCCGTLQNPERQTEKSESSWFGGKKKPSKYRLKLKEAKLRAAVYYYKQAQNALAKKDITLAKSDIKKSLHYDQSLNEYHALLQGIISAENRADNLRNEALQLAGSKKWSEAVKIMEQALSEFKTMPNGRKILEKIKKDAYDWHCQLANAYLSKDDRDDASAQAKEALNYISNGQTAKNILNTVANRDRADELVISGEKMMLSDRYQQALDLFQHAYKLYPGMPQIISRITSAKKGLCDQIIESGTSFYQNKRYSSALRSFRRSKSILNEYKDIDKLIAQTAGKLADAHNTEAAAYFEKQLYGNAVFYDVLNLGYRPGNHIAKQRLIDCKKKIQKEIAYVMGFVGFDSSPKNRDLANTLEAEAVEHLNRVKPVNVLFMDRMNLASVIEEQNFNLTDLVDPNFRVERGRLKGVDALVVGKILENKVFSTSTTSYGKTTYQSGMKDVPNSEYPRAKRNYEMELLSLRRARSEVRYAERKLENVLEVKRNGGEYSESQLRDRRRKLERAQRSFDHAQHEAHIAHNNLISTPQYKSVPNILPHTYAIQHVTSTAKVGLFIKVLDTTTASIIYTDRITGTYSDSDKYVEGDSARNVVADPLDLPGDNAMADRAMKRAIENMKNSLTSASKMHGMRFVTKMRQAEKNGDSEQVVENCIRYLFAYPVGAKHTNRMISYLESLIPNEKDLVNLNTLFRNQCRVLLKRAEFPANLIIRKDNVVITKLNAKISDRIKLPCTLISIDGQPISSIKEVDEIMTRYAVGDRMVITVMSNNKNYSSEIELAKERY